ncbi:MAG: hypothetical protein ACRCYX_00170 [Dermatophilaceae bacterium]
MDDVNDYLAAIVPTIGVSVLFYFIVKAMMEGDRRERLAQSQFEAERDRAERCSNSPEDDAMTLGADPGSLPTDSVGRHASSE